MNPATRSFLRAAAEGDANLVRALLAQGTDVNSKNAAGQSALMLASAFGHLAVVKILLAAGAERDLQDDLGFNALDWSVNYTSIGELITAPKTEPQPPEVPTIQPTAPPPPPEVIVKTEEPAASQPVRRSLGGLAGAILRDKAVKVADTESPEEVLPTVTSRKEQEEVKAPEPVPVPLDIPVELPPPSKVEDAVTTSDFDTEPAPIVQPRLDAVLASEPLPPISSLFKPRKKILTPLPEDDIPDLPPSFETPAPVKTTPVDDDTWSGRETDDTASPATRPIAATRIFDESIERPVASKVKVDVPSFKPIHQSTPRPILWLLIILFIGIGAYGGYRLSNYLFDKQNKEGPKETSVQQTQPLAAPIKLGPVVGGNLSGLELLVPDASYPPSAKIDYGSVTVRVQVDQKGRVTSARATDGDKSLRAAAEEAARRAAFSPEKLIDKGRFVVGTITYNFLAPQVAAANSPAAPAPTAQSTSTPTLPGQTGGAPKVGGPLAGMELKVPAPEYPAAARRDGLQGIVTLVIRVNNSGKVVSWRTLEGDQRLRAAAIRAARAATFDSGKLPKNGDVVGTITYTFRP